MGNQQRTIIFHLEEFHCSLEGQILGSEDILSVFERVPHNLFFNEIITVERNECLKAILPREIG